MGTSTVLPKITEVFWDHPHACGDKRQIACEKINKMGSSPRVWGQDSKCGGNVISAGIIPTRVGTSDIFFLVYLVFRDHPHACGDKQEMGCVTLSVAGSSPRVWGQVEEHIKGMDKRRIIPTRVGTRGNRSVATNTGEDHPHACGDKYPVPVPYWLDIGSSPRVWGQGS